MKFLLFITLFISISAEARNVALILNGTSNAPGEKSEFLTESSAAALCLKSRGFEVDLMAGGATPKSKPESELYPQDFAFISRLHQENVLRHTELTASTLDNKLRELRSNLRSGDTLELHLNAHGSIVCEPRPSEKCSAELERMRAGVTPLSPECQVHNLYPGETPDQYPDQDCSHRITIEGRKVKSKDLMDFVKEMDAKGVKVNLLSKSCFSGINRAETTNLPNTCSYFASGDRNVGMGCATVDPDEDIQNLSTNTNSAMMLRACQGKESLLTDPYFQNDKCFAPIAAHLRERPESTAMNDIFMEARGRDLTLTSPVLSCMSSRFFTQDIAASAMTLTQIPIFILPREDHSICVQTIETSLNELVGQMDSVTLMAQPGLANAFSAFKSSMERYNEFVRLQVPALNVCRVPAGSNVKGGACAALADYQLQTKSIAEDVVEKERALFRELRTARPDVFAECEASVACSRSLP